MLLLRIIRKIRDIWYRLFRYVPLVLDEINYDDYWKDKRGANMGYANSFQVARADWIVERIEEGARVMDIGCGDGAVLLRMIAQKDFHAIGADMSDYALDFLSSKGIETIKFDLMDFAAVEKLPKVDYILMLELLEHIPNPEKFLKLIEKKAKKSIFFSFPNTGYIMHRLRLLFGRFPLQWRLHPGEHVRFWTYRDLKWWLKELNYREESSIYTYQGLPILNNLWPSLFAEGFVISVKK